MNQVVLHVSLSTTVMSSPFASTRTASAQWGAAEAALAAAAQGSSPATRAYMLHQCVRLSALTARAAGGFYEGACFVSVS